MRLIMSKAIYNVEENKLTDVEALVSTPNNFTGEVNVRRNEGDAKYAVFVRDDATLEKILIEYLKEDTPSEKISEVVLALRGLKVQDEDTIYDQLRNLGLKTYIEAGLTLHALATALYPLFT